MNSLNKTVSKADIENKNKILNNKLVKILEEHLIGKLSKDELQLQSKIIQDKISENDLQLAKISNIKSSAFLLEQQFKEFLYTLDNLSEDRIKLIKSTISKVIITKISKKEYKTTIKYKFQN